MNQDHPDKIAKKLLQDRYQELSFESMARAGTFVSTIVVVHTGATYEFTFKNGICYEVTPQ